SLGDTVFYLGHGSRDTISLFNPVRRTVSGYLTGAKELFRFRVNGKGEKWAQSYVDGGLAISRIVGNEQVEAIDTVQYRWYYDVVGIWNDHYYIKISDRVYVFDQSSMIREYPFLPK